MQFLIEKTINKNRNTKALWTHMKSIHPADNIELTKIVNEDKEKKSKQNESMRKNINNNYTQLTLKHMFDKKEKYEPNHPKQVQ